MWRRLASGQHEQVLEHLLARHREPHRRYHTATHVMWVCRHVDHLLAHHPVDDADAVHAAALFHDAVHDPRSTTNEVDSAALAERQLTQVGWSQERTRRVAGLVLATAHLDRADRADRAGPDVRTDTAADVLLDADLAILGAEPASYRAYVTGVRAEYAHVDDRAWTLGRAGVLEHFLATDSLYRTSTMRADRERRARANLGAELRTLQRKVSAGQ